MPAQWSGQVKSGELDMDDPPSTRADSFRGGVQKERAHQKHVARSRGAEDFRDDVPLGTNRGCVQPTVTMTSRENAERSVGFIGVIKVQSRGQHLLEVSHGWLHVSDAVFDAPRTKLFTFVTFCDCDSQILMLGDRPVALWSLVEVDTSHRERRISEIRAHHFGKHFGGEGCDFGNGKQMTRASTSCAAKKLTQLCA